MANNKASGGDGIPVELYKILKDDTVKVLLSIWQQIWKTQQWPEDWKRSVYIPIPKKGSAKYAPTTVQLHSFHTLARLCSKSYKVGFSSRTPRTTSWTKLLTCAGFMEKAREFQKNIYFCFS